MTTSPVRRSREETPLLDTHERARSPNQNPPASSGKPVAWGFASLVTLVGAGATGAEAVEKLIAGDKVTGGLLIAGALVCASLGCICLTRLAKSLIPRNVQQIAPEQAVVAVTHQRALEELHQAAPPHDVEAAKVNLQVLREINTRLMQLLPNEESDLEAGIADDQLHESIRGRLLELEQILPSLRQELVALKRDLQSSFAARTLSSPSGAGLDSPGVGDSSFEQRLLDRVDKLGAKIAKDKASRNSSTSTSFENSFAGGNVSSVPGSPLGKPISPAQRALKFDGPDNTPQSPQKEGK